MGRIFKVLHGLQPVMLMMVVQVAYTGMNVLYKLVANDGMNLRILIAYRLIFATAFMVPVALILERGRRPKLTWIVLFQAFLCGLLGGSLAQNLYVESLALTSATYATAMSNLIPAITFILAISFRLENLRLKTKTGIAKVLGTSVGTSGAMLLTFYKGAELKIWSTNINLLHHSQYQSNHRAGSDKILGSILALASCTSYALWLIIQTKMSKRYPCHYSSTALMCGMASLQSVIFTLCIERNWSQWKLGWNIRLFTSAYTGIVTSGLVVLLVAWTAHMKGPFFVSSFTPLSLVLIAIVGSLVLEEKLHLGSVLGAVLIVCGLYMVLWGKSKEAKEKHPLTPKNSIPQSEQIEVITSTGDAARDGGQLK
ncbi:hypothetical protein Tsubulata_018009 [Turnera subulata]|uniref:WAT1-related protein n=1 Tax=Turnera subulata TaxID=218843 RepID=A0A9Q0JNH2_9ROSI|nr:hypothetical protein Tsubulata_018009 [Turnera subulata]